jgi:hypothetical protein
MPCIEAEQGAENCQSERDLACVYQFGVHSGLLSSSEKATDPPIRTRESKAMVAKKNSNAPHVKGFHAALSSTSSHEGDVAH